MDILFLVLFFVIISLLIIVMFLLLKRLVSRVNQQSIDYFVDKLKAYDNLIDDREKKLQELTNLIENKTEELNKKEDSKVVNAGPVFIYDTTNVSYKDEDIFKKLKEVNKKFDFNNEQIVRTFFENKFDNEVIKDYNKYYMIRNLFSQDVIFDILTKKENEQVEEIKKILGDSVEVLDNFMKNNKSFNLKKFISYLNKIVEDLDPYIYVYVGNRSENYDNISEYIKTEFDDSIFKGVKIIYKGKMYDYSL